MSFYQNVVIRTKEQLSHMGEIGDAILEMDDNDVFCQKKFPVVYQYMKGADGESVDTEKKNIIGDAYDVHIDAAGNLVCDIVINPMMRRAVHFQNMIDNLVVAKHIIDNKKEQSIVNYELVQFVVYDKDYKKEQTRLSRGESMVQKNYAAPKEAYTGNPKAGGHVKEMLQKLDDELKEVTDNRNGNLNVSTTNVEQVLRDTGLKIRKED